MPGQPSNQEVLQAVQSWVRDVVIGLNLCPFARREMDSGRVRFLVAEAVCEEQLLESLHQELTILDRDDGIETTVLVHPGVLGDFGDYNDFLSLAESLLTECGWEGVYQVASFHPDYQFAGTEPEDPENATNRSPYPLLHLLREESVARAVESHPDIDSVPRRNIELMRRLAEQKSGN